jgi:hypothetical protein
MEVCLDLESIGRSVCIITNLVNKQIISLLQYKTYFTWHKAVILSVIYSPTLHKVLEGLVFLDLNKWKSYLKDPIWTVKDSEEDESGEQNYM